VKLTYSTITMNNTRSRSQKSLNSNLNKQWSAISISCCSSYCWSKTSFCLFLAIITKDIFWWFISLKLTVTRTTAQLLLLYSI